MKKDWFCKYSVKVGRFFVKNHGFKQNCDFHGWERGGKGELIAPELDPGRSRIDVQLEELPVWKMCPFQLNGICFKENRS